MVDTCTFFLGEGRRLYGMTVPSEMSDKQLFTFRAPVGAAAIVTAGNFPVAVPSWYLVPALLCGNTVVWKPAEYAPATAEAFAQLFLHAGFPPARSRWCSPTAPTTFAGLETALEEGARRQGRVHGSTDVGRRIGELCGGTCSAVPRARREEPARRDARCRPRPGGRGRVVQRFGTAGQRCTSLGTAIVHADVHEDFVDRFTKAVAEAPIGDPTADVLYGPMIDARFAERFEGWLGLIREHHDRPRVQRGRTDHAADPREGFVGDDPEAGLYYHPTIVDGVTAEDELYRMETFGPIVGVATFETFDEAIALANGHGYGLSSSIYTTDPLHAFRFRERVSAGMVSVNNSTSGAEAHLPFGGNGKSGNGSRQSGVWVLDQFTRWQAMNWDYRGGLQKAQMDVADVSADLTYRLPD